MDNLVLKLRISSNNLEQYSGILYQSFKVISFDKILKDIYKKTVEKYGTDLILEDENISKHNSISQKECIFRIVISMDNIMKMTGINISSGMKLQDILLFIKTELDKCFTSIDKIPTFNNKKIKEGNLGLNNVLLYEFLLKNGTSDATNVTQVEEKSVPESTNNKPDTNVTEQVNTGDEVVEGQENSKNTDQADSNGTVNITGNNIQNLFPPTIQLQAISFDIEAPDETKEEVAAHIGVVPFIYYNGIEIRSNDIISFRLTSSGTLPTFSMIFYDAFGFIKDIGMPLDDTKIRFFLNSMIDGIKSVDIQFKISNYKTLNGGKYYISGIMDINTLFVPKYASYRGSSSEALQTIAKTVGLGFNTNIQSSSDTMVWINCGKTLFDYTKDIVAHSYISDSSFIYGFTDYYYNYNFVDVSVELDRDISSDINDVVLNMEKGIDPNTTNTTNVPFLTNEPSMEGTNYFFRTFKIFNDSTEFSQRTGYRTRTKYYDYTSKELLSFDVASNMSGDDKSKVILRSADEQYLNDNIIHQYDGKVDTDNMHKNYTYAEILNDRNITDLEKIGIVIELDNPNYNIYKFQKINLYLSNGEPNATNNLINTRLSGEWIISDINYVMKRGVFKQEIVLLKRELQLSPEEMDILAKSNMSETYINRTKFRNPTSGRNTDVGDYSNGYDDLGPVPDDEPIIPLPGGEIITPEEMREIFGLSNTVINSVIVALNNELKSNNYTSIYRVAHIVAQIYVESKFRPVAENLNYSASGLIKTWPTRFNSSNAQQYARQPRAIANKVYNGRMGNTVTPNDGWLFAGKGFLQLTGRDNYRRCGKALGVNLESQPQLLLQVKYAMKSTFWFFTSNKLTPLVDRNDITAVSKRVNGGTNHLSERIKYTQKAIKVLSRRKKK